MSTIPGSFVDTIIRQIGYWRYAAWPGVDNYEGRRCEHCGCYRLLCVCIFNPREGSP